MPSMNSVRADRLSFRSSLPPDPEVQGKLRGMLFIRLVFSVIAFLSGPMFFQAHAPSLYFFTGALFFLTLLYLVLLRLRFDAELFANVQIFGDVLLVTVLITLTGWENSKFGFFYIIPIVTASLFFRLRQTISIALLSSILYAAVVVFHRYRLSPPARESSFEMYYSLYTRAIIFCMVGYLCGHLANLLKRERERLTELKSLHYLILSSMNSGLITTDSGHNIVFANRAAEEMLGRPLAGMLFRFIGEFFADNRGEPFRGTLEERVEKGQDLVRHKAELQAQTPDGRRIPIGFNLAPIVHSSGRPVGNVMVFSDLTRVKELERKLRAIDKFRTAGELAAGIAHEIRNPLTSIVASIEMLVDSPEVSETNRQLLSVILKESARLNKIIEDFLAYARRGNLDLKKEDLCDIIKESLEMVGRGGKLTPDIRIELVTPTEPAVVSADRSQMCQVFLNLLSNAVDAMGGSGTVSITIDPPTGLNDSYSVTITDAGCGIPVENLGRVFEPFFTTKKNGAGIGLSIAERIVREHSGHIQIVSQEGKGTSATVVIPRDQGVGSAAEKPLSGSAGVPPAFAPLALDEDAGGTPALPIPAGADAETG